MSRRLLLISPFRWTSKSRKLARCSVWPSKRVAPQVMISRSKVKVAARVTPVASSEERAARLFFFTLFPLILYVQFVRTTCTPISALEGRSNFDFREILGHVLSFVILYPFPFYFNLFVFPFISFGFFTFA